MVSPMIQAAIETAMKDEEHIELDCKVIRMHILILLNSISIFSTIVSDRRRKKK